LIAEEEPEDDDYPDPKKYPDFAKKYGPRGVIHSIAGGKIEDTGPLTKKRMETIDDESIDGAKRFIRDAVEAGEPFFVWWNGTRMHLWTHVKKELRGISGQDEYGDGMIEHDMHVGQLLDLLDELGVADNTIVQYGTDNGPHKNSWPDAASSPFRGEKNTNWEGGWRTPSIIRWPGHIEAGSVSNEIISGLDWLPTYLAAAGDDKITEKLLKGHKIGKKTYKVHLDGYNMLPLLTGKVKEGPRHEIFYFSDDGDLTALRYDDWKLIFMEQRMAGTMGVWANPFTPLRVPLMFNLRRDPYEYATISSNTYWDWVIRRSYLMVPAQDIVGQFLMTFIEYPPRMKAASFSLDKVMEQLLSPGNN